MRSHQPRQKPFRLFFTFVLFWMCVTQVSHGQPIVYDWTPDSGSATGFIEFDEAAITDPENFTISNITQVAGGQFNFNESRYVNDFDILDAVGDGVLPTLDLSFEASDGELVAGQLRRTNNLFGVQFLLSPSEGRVSCSFLGFASGAGCGAPPSDVLPTGVESTGTWIYRQSQPTPEPSIIMTFIAGSIALTAAMRRQRHNVKKN